jgi:hypothetical protein
VNVHQVHDKSVSILQNPLKTLLCLSNELSEFRVFCHGTTTGTARDGMHKAEDDTIWPESLQLRTDQPHTQCVGYPLLTLPVSTTGVDFQQQETTV